MKKQDYIYGIRPVQEAMQAEKELDRIFFQKGIRNPALQEIFQLCKMRGIFCQFVPIEKLNRITRQNHQGVIAVISNIEYTSLDVLLPTVFETKGSPLLIMLDRITDVRNLGGIARSAECAGVDAIIIPDRGSAQINADALKASAGALNNIAVCKESNLKTTLHFLKQSGVQIVACTEKAKKTIYECDYTLPTVIIMGSEEEGVSPEYLKLSDIAVKIPMPGTTQSLNVSVAAGIILFEAVRQKNDI